MNQTASIPPTNSASRVECLDSLLKKTLQRRRSLRAHRGASHISPLDPIHARIDVISAVLAWALRNPDEPPSVQRCSTALGGLTRDITANPRLDELVERVYAWSIAIACELLTIENLAADVDDEVTQFEEYAPRAIALLDETVGPLLGARAGDDLALASIRRIVADLRQTLVLCTSPLAIAA